MATISTHDPLPLNEVANRIAADGGVPEIFFGVMQKNQLLEKLKFVPSSHETKHEYIETISKPTGKWTHVNVGIKGDSSRTAPRTEYMGRIEDYSHIDVRAFEGLSKVAAAKVRQMEDRAFMEGIGQTVSGALVYESQGNEPDAFDGLYAREPYRTLVADGGQVIDAGGSTALGSILMLEMGPDAIYGIYPKGTKVGLEKTDKGVEPFYDANGRFDVVTTHFAWRIGIVIKDITAVVRIANLTDDKTNDGSTAFGPDEDFIIDGFAMLPNMGTSNTYLAMNRRQLKNIQKALKDRLNVTYTPDDPFGRKWVSDLLGAQIILHEQLLNAESKVV